MRGDQQAVDLLVGVVGEGEHHPVGPRAGLTGRAVGRLTRVPEGNPQKAGYVLLDAYAQWLPTGRDDWSITLTVKNLLDHFHYDQTTYGYNPRWGSIAGLPEPGRDVRVTLAWRL